MADKETLQIKNWITREYDDPEYEAQIQSLKERIQILEDRRRVLYIFIGIFSAALFVTFLIIILQSFNITKLDTSTINILATATIGQIAGLLYIAYKWLYAQ